MARRHGMHRGSSGAHVHTETHGDGGHMRGGEGSRPARLAANAQPGALASRVRPKIMGEDTSASAEGASRSTPKGMRIYREE